MTDCNALAGVDVRFSPEAILETFLSNVWFLARFAIPQAEITVYRTRSCFLLL